MHEFKSHGRGQNGETVRAGRAGVSRASLVMATGSLEEWVQRAGDQLPEGGRERKGEGGRANDKLHLSRHFSRSEPGR